MFDKWLAELVEATQNRVDLLSGLVDLGVVEETIEGGDMTGKCSVLECR